MTPPGAPPAEPPQPFWRRAVPFALALALVTFVLARLDLRAFVATVAGLDWPLFVVAAAGGTVALLFTDTLATVLIYRRLVAPVRYRDFLVMRGASYLPSLLNHHVGQAFLTYVLSRAYDVPLLRVAGATLVGYTSWAGCILGVGSIALAAGGQPLWLLGTLVAGLGYLGLLALRPPALARTPLLAPLFEAGVTNHLIALAARVPHFGVLFAMTWIPFALLDVDLPLATAARHLPILMVLVTLPLTPQGLGTRDAFAAAVFAPFAAGATEGERLARVAAATMSWAVTLTLVEATIGLVLMRHVLPLVTGQAPRRGPDDPR